MPEKNSVVYKVKANEFEFCFTQEQIDAIDLVQKSPTVYNLLKNHRSMNAVLIEADQSAKMQTIEIEGEKFDIQIKDELDGCLVIAPGAGAEILNEIGHAKLRGQTQQLGVLGGFNHRDFAIVELREIARPTCAKIGFVEIENERNREHRDDDHQRIAMLAKKLHHKVTNPFGVRSLTALDHICKRATLCGNFKPQTSNSRETLNFNNQERPHTR